MRLHCASLKDIIEPTTLKSQSGKGILHLADKLMKIDIAGLKVDSITKADLLNKISERVDSNQKTFIITPYSEFLYQGLQDSKIMELFNSADFAVPDGIGIVWAHKFLSIPLTAKSYYGKILQAFWQMKYSGA